MSEILYCDARVLARENVTLRDPPQRWSIGLAHKVTMVWCQTAAR